MASGHVNRIKRPDTWLHRPMLQNVKKVLANPEPSTHGTKRTWPDVRLESAFGGRAEVEFRGRQVRFDPSSCAAASMRYHDEIRVSSRLMAKSDVRNDQ